VVILYYYQNPFADDAFQNVSSSLSHPTSKEINGWLLHCYCLVLL